MLIQFTILNIHPPRRKLTLGKVSKLITMHLLVLSFHLNVYRRNNDLISILDFLSPPLPSPPLPFRPLT